MAKRKERPQLTPKQQVLAETSLNLARNIAWKYHRSTNIEYTILEGAAFEGLCQAAGKYDPELINQDTGQPMRFSSLAVPYIRGSILHYIRDRTYSLRLTHRMRELWVQGRRMLAKGENDIDIALALGISLGEWQDTKTACSGPPLELKDQATPTEALEPDEIDQLTPFREEASELICKMSPPARKRLEKFILGRSTQPTPTLMKDVASLLNP